MIKTSSFARQLLSWYEKHGRELPWRKTKDPYAIWLSEVILQQTRIQQGWAYWERFMRRWPTVEMLAAATEDEVLREWQGLGYYSRARNLHTAAKQIVAAGGFPDTLESIRQLKGVGDYTAAAIASFAFDIPAAVVDGNVYRVLSRYFGIETPINTTEGKKLFATLAHDLLPHTTENHPQSTSHHPQGSKQGKRNPGLLQSAASYNQAIMDFGALQCTPKSPACMECPLMETCEAARTGKVETLPVKIKTVKVKTRRMAYVYLRCKGETAIHRRGEGDIWQGLWEVVSLQPPPTDEKTPKAGEGAFLQEESWIPDLFGKDAHVTVVRRNVKHVLTHRILLADFFLVETDEKPTLPEDYIWIKEADIDNYGVPRLIEIMLNEIHQI